MPSTPFLPIRHPVTEGGALPLITEPWRQWAVNLNSIVKSINQIPGVNRHTFAELNALGLGASDDGYLAFESNYGHMLRWTGSVWQFAPGDVGNRFFRTYAGAPQEVGWQVCDGTASDYLTVGTGTLSATAFTTPNVTSGTFLKVLAAYTGAIEAAIAATISGSTGNSSPSVNGTTANSSGAVLASVAFGVDVSVTVQHAHGAGSLAVDSHSHSNGSLAASTAARPPSLGTLLYYRR